MEGEAYGGMPVARLAGLRGRAPRQRRVLNFVDRLEQGVEQLEILLRDSGLPPQIRAAAFERVEEIEHLLEEIEHVIAKVV